MSGKIMPVILMFAAACWAESGAPSVAPAGLPPGALATGMLNAHNLFRARVGVAPLEWSDELAAFAQEWADTLIERGQFRHRSHLAIGENIYEINGGKATPERVLRLWAEVQSPNYDYLNNKCVGKCGHYLQVVWSETRKVGCAVASASGREVWVCNYDPRGNYVGLRPFVYAARSENRAQQ